MAKKLLMGNEAFAHAALEAALSTPSIPITLPFLSRYKA